MGPSSVVEEREKDGAGLRVRGARFIPPPTRGSELGHTGEWLWTTPNLILLYNLDILHGATIEW